MRGMVELHRRENLREVRQFSYKMRRCGREQLTLSASKFVHVRISFMFNNFLEELC